MGYHLAKEISITFVSDKFIHRLNRQYRGIDSPTDVLAFSMQEGSFTEINSMLLGDVVISVDSAMRQAEEIDHPLNNELTILLIHGLLHLLGYDHMKQEEEILMKEKEEKIFNLCN